MEDSYIFKEAEAGDLNQILQWTEALMEHELLSDDIELQLADNISGLLEEWIKHLIIDHNSLLIIAQDSNHQEPKGLIIGYMQAQPNNFTIFEMHGVIQMVWVEPSERKKGLARKLVAQMETTFCNLHLPYCELQYSDSNLEAKAFWDQMGYKITSHSCRKIFK